MPNRCLSSLYTLQSLYTFRTWQRDWVEVVLEKKKHAQPKRTSWRNNADWILCLTSVLISMSLHHTKLFMHSRKYVKSVNFLTVFSYYQITYVWCLCLYTVHTSGPVCILTANSARSRSVVQDSVVRSPVCWNIGSFTNNAIQNDSFSLGSTNIHLLFINFFPQPARTEATSAIWIFMCVNLATEIGTKSI